MIILGIETSCDETAAAILKKEGENVTILANIVSSSVDLQAKYGGVIPEQAAREQLKVIIPVIEQSVYDSRHTIDEIDAIAVTQGPGLIGSLLVGVETAKTLSLVWNKPIIPVNHLLGHFYANWINQSSAISYQLSDKKQKKSDDCRLTADDYPKFPCLGLLVSGGHSDIILMKDHGKFEYLGGTRDDASGECFDKCARLLGLAYPGGPQLSKLAEKGNPKAFPLPRPMIDSSDFDFSFSGLKTAVLNLVKNSFPNGFKTSPNTLSDLCASIEDAITDCLVKKVIRAAGLKEVKQVLVAGGVASNNKLREKLSKSFAGKVFFPPPFLCTDNAVMIASFAFFNYHPIDPLKLEADPSISLNT